MKGWFSQSEISLLRQELGSISTTRRAFSEGIRREPSEYRDLVLTSGSSSGKAIRAILEADKWLKGEIESGTTIDGKKVYHLIDIDILGQFKLEHLYEFSLIADAKNEEEGQKLV